jgi:adenine-specific DNA methylase
LTVDSPRLIEVAFPLKQASLDSVHEKNVRHGHISTLHIWPARRPLAACRAALIATLLPDPGRDEERRKLLERLGGKVVQKTKRKRLPGGGVEETVTEETEGGVLHWGRESGPDLEWFKTEIRKAYGGRPPRVLDPFAGGGAIPLEAMRLGCEAVAVDINPVAWFILKCTLEYPQKLAGQKRPLPGFILRDREFLEDFYKAQGLKGTALANALKRLEAPTLSGLGVAQASIEADLAWHVRAWGRWVLEQAKKELAPYYPVVDGKPTVAYLWARTVTCKNCRATIPLLKTGWLCKKEKKRVILTMAPNADRTGVVFRVEEIPPPTGTAAQKREHDRQLGAGTMSRSGATCPLCGTIMTMGDLRLEGQAGRLGAVMTAVVVEGPRGKEYRLPQDLELTVIDQVEEALDRAISSLPFGAPTEATPNGGSGAARAFSVRGYGLDSWAQLHSPRQLTALGTLVRITRDAGREIRNVGYDRDVDSWAEAVSAYLALSIDRLADYSSAVCSWHNSGEKIGHTFARFAFPMVWDYAEVVPGADTSGGYPGAVEWVADCLSHLLSCGSGAPGPSALQGSVISKPHKQCDLVVTDPPYYDAIPYSDLMDFFYVWLRRTLHGLSPEIDQAFKEPLSPKWDHEKQDGELIDDASRFGGDKEQSKKAYEDGMYRAFRACHQTLKPDGRLVIVFAHKQPDAWESLVSAIIRAGFVVDGSWPIQTEMGTRMRALSSAALSSSVWLVCRKRPEAARAGWDNRVLDEMREKLYGRQDAEGRWVVAPKLRDFWDAGVRGPDFVWAATGPALEAYSQYPVVKKANAPGEVLTVTEFLRHVRRLVVDFVVGRVFSHSEGEKAVSGLDDVTTYYLLHRHDFGLGEAPSGACILYAVSCGLSDRDLMDQYDLLARAGGDNSAAEDGAEDEAEGDEEENGEKSGSMVKLKPWNRRTRKGLGAESGVGRPAPLIDQVHHLMRLWRQGDVVRVDEYLEERSLRSNALFRHLLQALIELAPGGSEERSLLESISNHLATLGEVAVTRRLIRA